MWTRWNATSYHQDTHNKSYIVHPERQHQGGFYEQGLTLTLASICYYTDNRYVIKLLFWSLVVRVITRLVVSDYRRCVCVLLWKQAFYRPWWRRQMETFPSLLAICAGNSPIPSEFPAQRPVTRSFDAFFDLLNSILRVLKFATLIANKYGYKPGKWQIFL